MEKSSDRYKVYFSHSWKPEHVTLNKIVWDEIHARCDLLVDDEGTPKPPYYINRIEEYIRRSDLFLAVLTYRQNPEIETRMSAMLDIDGRDVDAACSTASLFEVRLAERARKPRLVLYDTRTRFTPGSESSGQVCYQEFEEHDVLELNARYFRKKIQKWLEDVSGEVRPRDYVPNRTALVLLAPGPNRDAVFDTIAAALKDKDVNYRRVLDISNSWTDVQIIDHLFSTSLLVAEIGAESLLGIYTMAHALFVPTIRLLHDSGGKNDPELPHLLRGHPKGYQADIVRWSKAEDLPPEVKARAQAMRDTRRIITSKEEGDELFERRRYSGAHRIFISHNLRPEDRRALDSIISALRKKSISAWEYRSNNRSADEWERIMDEELKAATHGIVILANEYELSKMCTRELDILIERKVPLFPYLWAGRTRPNPRLEHMHHEPLDADPERAALQVVSKLLERIAPGAV